MLRAAKAQASLLTEQRQETSQCCGELQRGEHGSAPSGPAACVQLKARTLCFAFFILGLQGCASKRLWMIFVGHDKMAQMPPGVWKMQLR